MIFELGKENIFPPVSLADESGIIAIGGDLSYPRLIEAYRSGIFPWYSENEPIIWWTPESRFVLFPDEIIVSRSMRKILNREIFKFTYDQCFKEVIELCSSVERKQEGTWITNDMIDAYNNLHEQGMAHSIEAWNNGELVGGLYGVSMGRCFFGESMFTKVSNASKAAFITLIRKLKDLDFFLIDCQVYTEHLQSLGARMIPRKEFISILNRALKFDTVVGNWGNIL